MFNYKQSQTGGADKQQEPIQKLIKISKQFSSYDRAA
jgi:hypothetical protein